MRNWLIIFAAIALCAAAAPTPADTIDAVAQDYVVIMLGAHEMDPELVTINEARPHELKAAKAAKLNALAIADRSTRLVNRLDRLPRPTAAIEAMRMRRLRAMLASLKLQMEAKAGAKRSIADEVRVQYAVDEPFKPLAEYDAALDRLDKAMPGPGSLAERIASLRTASIVPPERLAAVFKAALAECRKRTVTHLKLPPESTEVQFVDEDTFPAENIYIGGGKSVTRISRKIPAEVDRVLMMACHEAYPGHHVHSAILMDQLYTQRGWIEFAVDLNSGPSFAVAESVAEHAVGLAFPIEQRIAFERDTLYPLAGLTMQRIGDWRAYIGARSDILGATSTVARDYLEKKTDRETAYRQLIRYRLQTSSAANQTLKVFPVVGSAIIASDMGWYTVDRMMKGKSIEEQWRLLARIQSEPMLLEDVAALR